MKCPENYRPITLLPILYKLFSRMTRSRISSFLEKAQCPDQAGFRSGFGVEDHLLSIVLLVEKSAEFRNPLWICAIDFKKAFDTVDHPSLFKALRKQLVPEAYVRTLASLYAGQVGRVCGKTCSKLFAIERGTKQGDPISPNLFNAVLEDSLHDLQEKWRDLDYGVAIGDGGANRLCYLRFADDIVLVARSRAELLDMLDGLVNACGEVGLELHMGKTKILANEWAHSGTTSKHVAVSGHKIEVLPLGGTTMYLGRLLSLDTIHETELEHRLERAWKKFHVWKHVLCNRSYSLRHRLKLFESAVTPTILYGSSSWSMTSDREAQLRTLQRRMLRWIVGVGRLRRTGEVSPTSSDSSSDESEPEQCEDEEGKLDTETWVEWCIRATGISEHHANIAGVTDWVHGQRQRKWNFAGHTARREDGRWSTKLLKWAPELSHRGAGHPKLRWADPLTKYTSAAFGCDERTGWTDYAQDRLSWAFLLEDFVVHRW
jgi:hypothetical protein